MANRLVRTDSRESILSTSSCVSGVGGWQVGDRAKVGEKSATISFIGQTKFAPGEWVGLVLDSPDGKNDGEVQGTRYFTCADKHGLFVKAGKLTRIAMSPARYFRSPILGENSSKYAAEFGFDVGDRVIITGGKTGTLRYLDETEFANGIWGGIELDTAQGKNSGEVQGKRYFTCKPLFGIFVPAKNIQRAPSQTPSQVPVHHNKASILRTELGQSKKSGSRESLNSIGRSSIASSRFGLRRTLGGRGSTTTAGDEATIKALQKALEEKEKHIEQLVAERELVDYSQQSAESTEVIKKFEEKLKTSNDQIHGLKSELASKQKEIDDLKFQIEEENVTKQCEIEELQQKLLIGNENQSNNGLEKELEESRQKLAKTIENNGELQKRIAEEQEKYKIVEEQISKNNETILVLEREVEEARNFSAQFKLTEENLKRELEKKESNMKAEQEKVSLLSSQQGTVVEELNRKLIEMETLLFEREKQLENIQKELKESVEKLEKEVAEKETLKNNLAEVTLFSKNKSKEVEEGKKLVEKIQLEKSMTSEEKALAQKELLALQEKLRATAMEIEQLKVENEGKEKELKTISDQLQSKDEELLKIKESAQMSGSEKESQLMKLQSEMALLQQEKEILVQSFEEKKKEANNLKIELDLLKKEKKAVEDSLKNLQDISIQREDELSRELEEIRAKSEEANQKLCSKIEELQQVEIVLQKELASARQFYEEESSKARGINERMNEEVARIEKEKEELKISLESAVSLQEQTIETLEKEKLNLTAEKKSIESLKEELIAKNELLEGSFKEKEELQGLLRNAQDSFASLQSSVESFKMGEDAMAKDLATAKEEAARRIAEVETLQKQLETTNEKNKNSSKEVESLKNDIAEMTVKLRETEDSSMETVKNLERSLANEVTLRSKLENEVRTRVEEIGMLQLKLEEANSQLQILMEQSTSKAKLAEDELSQKHNQLSEIESGLQKEKEVVAELKTLISQKETEIDSLKSQSFDSQAILESTRRELREAEESQNRLRSELEVAKTELANSKETSKMTEDQLVKSEADLDGLRKDTETLRNELSNLQAKYDQITVSVSSSDEKNQLILLEKEKQIAIHKERSKSLENERKGLISRVEEMSKHLEEKDKIYQEGLKKMDELEQSLANKGSQIKELSGRLKDSEEKRKATEAMMESQEKNRLEQIRILEESKVKLEGSIKESEEKEAIESRIQSDQMAMEFEEALAKIAELNEERTNSTKLLEKSNDELSKLQIEVLALKKETIDATIQASEAKKKMELAEEMTESLMVKNLRLIDEMENLKTDGNDSELQMLRKIVATKTNEVDNLKRQLELALNPQNLLESLTPKRKEVVARIYCDICESFDSHETMDCPIQTMQAEEKASHSHHSKDGKKNKPAPREFCDHCEEFDHNENNCPKKKKRDYTF